ncbi:hypothetical protein GCM10023189_52590 [Nibrella saemangeumensis]|uniref:Holin-X, holin superfamily III n=1 Tax=Nibrella saemangeumensis TaxID=1084526 RepID=A0ABP8NMB6_9BACT
MATMLEKLDEIRENIFRYLEARIELFKLETRSKVEEGAVTGTYFVGLALLATITTIFVFTLLAAFLNHVLDSRYLGFLIVAGFFLILTAIWFFAKNGIQNWIRNTAYKAIKARQDHKAEEKSEAIRELMDQTRATMQESGRSWEQEQQRSGAH